MERKLLLDKTVDTHMMRSRVEVWDGSMVTIVSALLGDKATKSVSYTCILYSLLIKRALYLETSLSRSGSRLSGFSTEYSS